MTRDDFPFLAGDPFYRGKWPNKLDTPVTAVAQPTTDVLPVSYSLGNQDPNKRGLGLWKEDDGR